MEWHSCGMNERYSMGLRKAIRKESDLLSSRLAFQVGSGWRVRFRKDM